MGSSRFIRNYFLTACTMALFIVLAFTPGASAQLVNPTQTQGEDAPSKDTPFTSSDIVKTNPTKADPYTGEGGSIYYLPPGVPGEGKIHSNFSANTDACAACHLTHTAPGPRLLHWPSAYDACVSCHDGTLGDYTYDVFSGMIGNRIKRTAGGLFGDNIHIASPNNPANEHTLSNHMPNGSVLISAAPGGDPVSNHDEVLNCISCHTPHGQGGNARLINPDPNKLIFKRVKANPKNYAKWLDCINETTQEYKVTNFEYKGNWIPGYPYHNLTRVIIGKDLADFNLTLTGSSLALTGSAFFLEPEDYQINYRDGIVTLTATGVAKKNVFDWEVYAIYVPGIYVVMEIENYMTIDEKVTYLAKDFKDRTTSLNTFCGTCHTDYNTEYFLSFNKHTGQVEPHGSGGSNTGTFTQAYRHQMGSPFVDEDWGREETPPVLKFSMDGEDKIITCMTCHVAHGSDKEWWNDTTREDYPEFIADTLDSNPSSALKRLPNMAVCEACHQMKYAYQGPTGPPT